MASRSTPHPSSFRYNNGKENVEIDVNISSSLNNITTFREYVNQIIQREHIPPSERESFIRQLKAFVENELDSLEDVYFSEDKTKDETDKFSRFNSVLKVVSANRKLESSSGDSDSQNDSSNFWPKYHKLIHSGFLTEPLVTLEHSFSVNIEETLHERDSAIQDLREHQVQEMEDMLKRVGTSATEEDVNKLSVTHFAELDDLRKIWEWNIAELKALQKKEFTEWISRVCQDLEEKNDSEAIVNRIRDWTESSLAKSIEHDLQAVDALTVEDLIRTNSMDESFTINLGAQLKTTHNLRLLSSPVLDFCKSRFGVCLSMPTPQRIQTAMSLYSSHLSGLVLLTDNRVNSYSGLKKEFALLCEQSTDFHFPCLEDQLDVVRKQMESAGESTLRTGDFYITKHSNLSDVHVVFHLVSDESVMSSEVSSRHPIMLGLRNILKTAYLSDITTIALPLFLSHEMSEHMTMQWCLRRAELVFKCVKGFMIEMASVVPSHEGNRTIKFVLPEGIQEQLFSSLATMLPSIFRLSNPLVLSSSG